MMELPYGIADFRTIREQGLVYVDRTSHIRDLEKLGRILVFLRPRRFGKSLWLQTLASYYDLRLADEFDELFGALDIGRDPTPLKNHYFVLQWNLANVDASGDVREITEAIRQHVISSAKAFVADYRELLPETVEVDGNTDSIIESLLSAVRRTPYKLYLLIDEYDNFVNQVMVEDIETYHQLFGKAGPYKQLFKAVKTGTEGRGIERVFVTGVAPVALNDLTSGFNNSKDMSHQPALASLCGFRDREIHDLLGRVAADRGLAPEAVEYAEHVMRTWYNGYRFNEDVGDPVYNPTNALYFLEHLHRFGEPPKRLHDQNLRNDRSKLVFLARSAAGVGVIEKLTEGNDELTVELMESFSVDDLTQRLAEDQKTIASMLYYMGLLTRTDLPFRLRIPNLVVRKLFLERLLELYLPPRDSSGAETVARCFFQDGELAPLLRFFEERLLPTLSNRDRGAVPKPVPSGGGDTVSSPLKSPKGDTAGHSHRGYGGGVNHMVVKALFLSILFAENYYRVYSEPELEKDYADLCLLVRQEMRRYGFFDFLFEFKLVHKKTLEKTGQELKDMDEDTLFELPAVSKALTEARDQARRYRAALLKREGPLNLRTFVVVAVGLERMLGEEIGE